MSNANQTFRGKASLELQGTRTVVVNNIINTPGTEETLITYTVPVGFKLNVLGLRVTSSTPIVWKYKVDSSQQASGRCHPGSPNDDFSFLPGDELLTGSTIDILVESFSDRPSGNIEGYLQARLITV
jgi:hypothetical protein